MTDSLQDVIALLPCPFCGRTDIGETHVATYSLSSYDIFGCRDCVANFEDGTPEEWNTRLSALAAPVVSDADRRDAERYRWLKDRSLNKSVMDSRQQNGPFIAVGSILAGWSTPVDIDGAIDAAVAALIPGRSGEGEPKLRELDHLDEQDDRDLEDWLGDRS